MKIQEKNNTCKELIEMKLKLKRLTARFLHQIRNFHSVNVFMIAVI